MGAHRYLSGGALHVSAQATIPPPPLTPCKHHRLYLQLASPCSTWQHRYNRLAARLLLGSNNSFVSLDPIFTPQLRHFSCPPPASSRPPLSPASRALQDPTLGSGKATVAAQFRPGSGSASASGCAKAIHPLHHQLHPIPTPSASSLAAGPANPRFSATSAVLQPSRFDSLNAPLLLSPPPVSRSASPLVTRHG